MRSNIPHHMKQREWNSARSSEARQLKSTVKEPSTNLDHKVNEKNVQNQKTNRKREQSKKGKSLKKKTHHHH
uniref:Uncharacterized protein n=1 Tax=Physcomitrium patens TaxID=3218 RepID=A0A2K1IYK2_PHYPA|nr:hypothetical protein PHYPA_024173 [Physcomitrium patens]